MSLYPKSKPSEYLKYIPAVCSEAPIISTEYTFNNRVGSCADMVVPNRKGLWLWKLKLTLANGHQLWHDAHQEFMARSFSLSKSVCWYHIPVTWRQGSIMF